MTSLEQRQTLLHLIDKACHDGARLAQACRQIGLCARTVQRWQRPDRQEGDQRMAGQRAVTCPANQLSEAERQAALKLLSSDEFKDLPPSQIVPRLADQGRYVACESTLYRLRRRAGQMKHRRAERSPHKRSRPRAGGHAGQSALQLGHHLPVDAAAWRLLLSVPVCRCVQPQDCGLGSVRLRKRRAGKPAAAGHLPVPPHCCRPAHGAFRQRLTHEGRDDAGDDAASGRGTQSQPPCSE